MLSHFLLWYYASFIVLIWNKWQILFKSALDKFYHLESLDKWNMVCIFFINAYFSSIFLLHVILWDSYLSYLCYTSPMLKVFIYIYCVCPVSTPLKYHVWVL